MAGAREANSEFSFTAAVRGYHVYRRMWIAHLGQRLSAERERGNAKDCFAIAVREHSDNRADDDVDDRPYSWTLTTRVKARDVFTVKVNIDRCLVSIIIYSNPF